MNNFDMHLQMFCFRKRFPTEFTFIVFVAFMKCMDMFIREIGGGGPPKTQKSQKATPPRDPPKEFRNSNHPKA